MQVLLREKQSKGVQSRPHPRPHPGPSLPITNELGPGRSAINSRAMRNTVRPWQDIERELQQEVDAERIAKLAHELNEAMIEEERQRIRQRIIGKSSKPHRPPLAGNLRDLKWLVNLGPWVISNSTRPFSPGSLVMTL